MWFSTTHNSTSQKIHHNEWFNQRLERFLLRISVLSFHVFEDSSNTWKWNSVNRLNNAISLFVDVVSLCKRTIYNLQLSPPSSTFPTTRTGTYSPSTRVLTFCRPSEKGKYSVREKNPDLHVMDVSMLLIDYLYRFDIPIAEITAPEKASENPPVAFFGFSTLWGTHKFLK